MSNAPLLFQVNHLNIYFDQEGNRFQALKNIHFDLHRGETIALVGESGSGKTLTALALSTLLPKTAHVSGQIIWHYPDKTLDLLKLNPSNACDFLKTQIGFVFQEPMSALNPIKKIGHQLAECLQYSLNLNKKEAYIKSIEWLSKVHIPNPEKAFHKYPHQFSGGQKQRIVIAMALCKHPALIIADEPSTALDAALQQEIMVLINDLQKEIGASMLFISHDLSLATQMADTLLVMYQGEAIEYGPAKVVFSKPQQAYTQALLACKPQWESKGKALPVLSDFIEGTDHEQSNKSKTYQNARINESSVNILEVQDLEVYYPAAHNAPPFKALDKISFTLPQGSTLGLVGESGCGKSTIAKTLMGLCTINSGSFKINGYNINAKSSQKEWQDIRKKIQLVFQDPYSSLNPRHSVEQLIAEPLIIHKKLSLKETSKTVKTLLDQVGLAQNTALKYPHQFSGGQRQRISIARALALQPEILICDESVSALDISIQAQILNLLKNLQQSFGLSYLFISHDLTVVYYMADTIAVMSKGQIVEYGTAKQILFEAQNPYTQKLIAAMPQATNSIF